MLSNASWTGTLNSSICSRASKIHWIRRRLSSGVELRTISAMSPRISSLTSAALEPVACAMASR